MTTTPANQALQSPVDDTTLPSANTLGFVLSEQQQLESDRIVAAVKIEELTSGDIVQIGFPAEQALQQTLDSFLARLDKTSSNQVFLLFEQLEKGVKDANLQEVLQKVQDTKPSLFRRMMGYLKGKSLNQITRETYDSVRDLISGKTQTLAHEVGKIEKELSRSIQHLSAELKSLEELKESYHGHFQSFGTMAVSAQRILEKARVHVDALEAELNGRQEENPALAARVQDARQKLSLLESRTLSLVGAYTRLPADHVIIQQIEQAGVATLQETIVTASSRFASIKTTLLAINGAFSVKSVQQIAQKQAAMDQQLQQIRSQLTKEIVTTAMAAPGDNRLEQVRQVEKIIEDAKEIREIMKKAREINDGKFRTAREKFIVLRKELSA